MTSPNLEITQKNVLIVEDDEVIRDVLQQLLRHHGYQTHVAHHGKEALEKLPSMGRLDLVLMDLMMPVMNGWEMLAALRQVPGCDRLPVIILSAGGEHQGLPRDEHVRFLKKPLRMQVLLELVRSLCG